MQYYDKCLIQNGLSCAGFTNIIIDLFPIKTIVSFSNQLLLSINRFIQGTLIQIYTRYTIEKNRKNVSRSLQENLEVSLIVRTPNKNNKDISTIG